jgi:hypothetical protein
MLHDNAQGQFLSSMTMEVSKIYSMLQFHLFQKTCLYTPGILILP